MRSSIRTFLKNPGFTLPVVFALALGLGANTAVFSVVNGVLLKPLPFPEAEKLVIVRDTKLPQFPEFLTSPGNFTDWEKQNTVFESMAAWSNNRFNLVEGDQPEVLFGAQVTASLLRTIRMTPMLGRDFTTEEDQPGKSTVVIISHRLWQRRFGSDPNVLGRTVNLNARTYTIIGVIPPKQQFPNDSADVLVPIAFTAAMRANHGSHYMGAVGRLKNGTTITQASTEMQAIARRLENEFPDSNKGWGVKLMFLNEVAVGRVRAPLLVLLATVVFVLFIACANVANLLMVRSNTRQREMAIRVAIGASRMQVGRQVLAESLILAFAGGTLGVLLAYWGVDALLTVAPQIIPRIQDVRIDASVLLYTLTISVATGLIFGLIPAVQSSKPNLNDTLKETSRGSVGGHRQRSRHALIVAEVAISLVLLIGATLAIRSFVRLQRVNPGFDPQHALAVSLSLPQRKYPQESQMRGFVDRVLSEIRSLPGVESAGVGHVIPFMNDYVVSVVVDGQPKPNPGEDVNTNYYAVSPDYFKAMGIPVIRGRTFTGTDSVDSPRVAVVSQSFVKRFYGNEDPIGKQIQLTQGPEAWRKIVGIVGDVKTYGLDRETTLQAYEPYNQMTFGSMTFVVRTATDPATFSQSIRSRILSVDKDQPVTTVRPMDQTIAESVGAQKFSTWLLTAFAGIALVLATVGLYGMMSYLVTQRTHEIGLRMALGAQRRSVFQLVISQGLLLTIIGLVAGLAGAFGLTRLMSTMLYEVSATDPATFVVIPILLASVSVLACYIPARRAMKVDPMVALRYE